MKKAYGLIALLALSLTTVELEAQPTPRHRRDRREDIRDRREDVRDRREDVRDRREDVRDAQHQGGPLDRIEDRRDRKEDVRDRREDKRDSREDRRDRRRKGNYVTGSHPKPRAHVNNQVGFRLVYGPQFQRPRHHGHRRHFHGRYHHRHCRR